MSSAEQPVTTDRKKRIHGKVLVVGAVLMAAGALFVSGMAPPPRPAPRGLLNDGPAVVMVYDGKWHGAPPEAPFATVSGAFELTGFPYGDVGKFSSAFFVKEGSPALHVSVRAPEEDQSAAPEMGILQMTSLEAGKGSVTGVLVRLDVQGRCVESYVDAEVAFVSEGGAKVTTRSGGPEGFTLTLAPGSYEVLVNNEQATTPQVEVTAGQGAPLVLLSPGPLTNSK